jgi:hypothetical protein
LGRGFVRLVGAARGSTIKEKHGNSIRGRLVVVDVRPARCSGTDTEEGVSRAAGILIGAIANDNFSVRDDRDAVGEVLNFSHVAPREKRPLSELVRTSDYIPADRRADGSKPAVGPSRNNGFTSPMSASSTSRR